MNLYKFQRSKLISYFIYEECDGAPTKIGAVLIKHEIKYLNTAFVREQVEGSSDCILWKEI